MTFKQRTTAPTSTDKNFIRWDMGGHNYCMTIKGNSVLPNCTGYAWGRWREILGKFHELSRGDAEVWWGKGDGYQRGQTPKVGAVIAWRQGTAGNRADGMGHVAIVEEVHADGSITTSNSAYNGTKFYTQTLKKPYIYKPGFVLQGFIYLPADAKPAPKPVAPEPKPVAPTEVNRTPEDGIFKTDRTVNIRTAPVIGKNIVSSILKGAEVRYDSFVKINGYVWVSFMRDGKRVYAAWREIGGKTYGGCRYATQPAPQPVIGFKKGDKVSVISPINYDTGNRFKVWHTFYTLREDPKGARAVIVDHKGVIASAIDVKNLRKV